MAAAVPFAWVAADSVYGVGEIEKALRRAGKGYVLGVTPRSQFQLLGQARRSPARPRDRASPRALGLAAPVGGRGHQGPRLYDWAYLELADLDADEFRPARPASGHAAC